MKKSADSDESSLERTEKSARSEYSNREENGAPILHEANPESMPMDEIEREREREFRKKLNRSARETVSGSIHHRVKLVVHRPEFDSEKRREYERLSRDLMPVVRDLARKTLPLLEHDVSSDFAGNQYAGARFLPDRLAYKDFRYFAKKRPPGDSPSLAVGLRLDESASMSAFGRLEAAKRAAIAVYEFCRLCDIPILIYGDTADSSRLEQMSIFAYADFERADPRDRFRLMGIRARSNNRDGMALRIMAQRIAASPQRTKLLISVSDGQPKAMDDYTGSRAALDVQQTIAEYERKGVAFLAAAIGQDKEVTNAIYGSERFLDIAALEELPAKLVRIIARYL